MAKMSCRAHREMAKWALGELSKFHHISFKNGKDATGYTSVDFDWYAIKKHIEIELNETLIALTHSFFKEDPEKDEARHYVVGAGSAEGMGGFCLPVLHKGRYAEVTLHHLAKTANGIVISTKKVGISMASAGLFESSSPVSGQISIDALKEPGSQDEQEYIEVDK